MESTKICVDWFNKNIFDHLPDTKFWIAGGALREYFLNGHCFDSDMDLFFNDRSEIAKTLIILRRENEFKPYLITKNAIKGVAKIKGKKVQIDLVKKLFSSPNTTIEDFDFTVICCAVDREKLYFNPSFPFDLLRRKLVINSLPFPLNTLQRVQKYVKKGFTICNGGILEISKAIQKIDFEDPDDNSLEFYPDGEPRFVRFD